MKGFQSVDPKEITENWFQAFSKETPLLTAGTKEKFNTMTIGWGTVGYIWSKPIAEVLVRPSRYTYEFVEQEDYFTISFFGKDYRKEMGLCGSKSGRDIDKVAETGFTPIVENNKIAFEEARMVLVCKKIYQHNLDKNTFRDENSSTTFYADGDWHVVYYGEIVEAYIK